MNTVSAARRPPGRPRLDDSTLPTADQIVQGAADLFMELGYRAVTMGMVAERAGVTKAAVYYHFTDKAALLTEALVARFHQIGEATDRILARADPLRERLLALATMVLGMPEPLTRVEILVRVASPDLSEVQREAIRVAIRAVDDSVIAAIRDGIGRGEVRVLDPELLGRSFMTLMRVGGLRTQAGALRFPDPEGTARALVDMLWYGVAGGSMPPATEPS